MTLGEDSARGGQPPHEAAGARPQPAAVPSAPTAAFPVLTPRVLRPGGWSAASARRHALPGVYPPRLSGTRGAYGVSSSRRRGPRRGLTRWQELPLLVVVAFTVALLVRTFLLQAFYIPSSSMEDTLTAGDRVLVDKLVYHLREPARGDVVVFEGADDWVSAAGPDPADEPAGVLSRARRAVGEFFGVSHPDDDYVKRVVGVPGDTVSCCDDAGRVVRNGEPLHEEYVADDSPLERYPLADCRGRRFEEIEVQDGHLFVMGDHRRVSRDSRCQGQIPVDNVIGRAFVIVWPSDRWGALARPDMAPASRRPLRPTAASSAAARGGHPVCPPHGRS